MLSVYKMSDEDLILVSAGYIAVNEGRKNKKELFLVDDSCFRI